MSGRDLIFEVEVDGERAETRMHHTFTEGGNCLLVTHCYREEVKSFDMDIEKLLIFLKEEQILRKTDTWLFQKMRFREGGEYTEFIFKKIN